MRRTAFATPPCGGAGACRHAGNARRRLRPLRRLRPRRRVAVPAAVKIDRSCRSNSDCAVKDVGNCCGAMPACVNNDSPTDPAGVQAACAKSGRMGVCGFKAIESCQCTQGQCKDRCRPRTDPDRCADAVRPGPPDPAGMGPRAVDTARGYDDDEAKVALAIELSQRNVEATAAGRSARRCSGPTAA